MSTLEVEIGTHAFFCLDFDSTNWPYCERNNFIKQTIHIAQKMQIRKIMEELSTNEENKTNNMFKEILLFRCIYPYF